MINTCMTMEATIPAFKHESELKMYHTMNHTGCLGHSVLKKIRDNFW